jgi:hypothetical protein
MNGQTLIVSPAFLLVAALMAGCASKPLLQESSAVKSQALSFAPPPDMACVYVVRPHQFGGDHQPPFRVMIDSNEWGLLTCETCIFGVVPPGDHELHVQGATDASSIAIGSGRFHADAGGNYFLEAAIGWTSLKVTQLSDADGRDRVNKFKLIGWSPETALSAGQWEIVKKQIEQGDNADFQDQKGLTPLFYAARYADPALAAFLLAHGADVNHVSKAGETPLMWAALAPGDTWQTADILIKAGADMNKRTPDGITPLGFAALAGNEGLALWLFEKGADPAIPEKQCEINGRLSQVLGDYYLARDNVEKARASFEKARQEYRTTVAVIKKQRTAAELSQTLFDVALFALDVAAQRQANIQAHQIGQVAALRQASRVGGGVVAYSAYQQKYVRAYVPTYQVGGMAPPVPSGDMENDFGARIKYYEQMEAFMGKVVACFTNYADLAELHGRIEDLNGQPRSP